jgi:hypothetical protein
MAAAARGPYPDPSAKHLPGQKFSRDNFDKRFGGATAALK